MLIAPVGSFGLVTVAPFTALAAGALYRGGRHGTVALGGRWA